ncbi:hypothetical protein BOTBODRAFT_142751 [Botryobasidium botryosum FD-172 SS1]|uniref:Phosphatidylglycerol/phosphatidylinositol transfer protein n=1 Tax=Botryobasidium botryosum (strain FD-172 SS1) TaxID=930990 RepID=A0A067MWS5_BOTB1|nr:hypothetical protein BOTBODRAFT_142751 [Botryobasidium botryosum FD-172 SS1]
MRTSVLSALLLAIPFVASSPLVPRDDVQFSNCGDGVLQLTGLDVSPSNPAPGDTITIQFSGNLQSTIESGSVVASISYGGTQVMQQTYSVCDSQDCPVQPGDQTFSQDFQVPSYAPAGGYQVQVVGTVQGNQRLACMNFDVQVQ